MQVENIATHSHKVDLETDEAALLHIFIAGLDEPNVTSINDLISLLLCYCCEHCTDHLIDPEKRLTENESRQKTFADAMNSRFNESLPTDQSA